MAEWESSYGGYYFKNPRLLTKEEISRRYPPEDNSYRAQLTRRYVANGYDILYGENPNIHSMEEFAKHNWDLDVLITAARLYQITPDDIITGAFIDMTGDNSLYVAVKRKYDF